MNTEETLLNFGTKLPTESDAGIYELVKKVWDPGDVGHKFMVKAGFLRAIPIDHGGVPFDWAPYLVYSSHLVRVPHTEHLFELLLEREKLQAEISKQMEKFL